MNKRFALTNINQLVRNIFSNCHQLPTWRNTPNGTTLVPMWTLISNLSSAITDVKPPTTNTSKQNDSQLELLCLSLTLVISQSFLSDKERTPSTGNTRDRDRSDQKKSSGESSYMYPIHFPDHHFPFPPDRNRKHLSPPVKEVSPAFLKRNLDPDQIAIFKTLTTAQKNRIRAKPNQPLEFVAVCNEIKESDINQLQTDLKGSDMAKRNRAKYLLIDLQSEEVKKNIIHLLSEVLEDNPDDALKPTTDSPSQSHAFDPFSTTPAPNSPPSDTPKRGTKGGKGGKGGKGAISQSRLQLDGDNLSKIITPESQRPLKAIGKVTHYNAANFLYDNNPDDKFIDGQDRTNPYVKAAMLTLLVEPGKSQIMGATLKFLAEFCDLQCEPPLRSAAPSRYNARPPWTIEFNFLEEDRQKLTNAITTLQKYGNKIPCTFTDEHNQPISVDLRFNLSEFRSFENVDRVSYICRWPDISVSPTLTNINSKIPSLYPPHPLPQISTEHYQMLIRDISKRQDKRCSPPVLLSDNGEFLLTDNFHIVRGHTSALSATSEMLIDVPNNSVIFTIELKKLLEYGTLKTALPPYAFVYHKFPDGTFGTIRCDINLVNTDDLGPGLCTKTRSTHFENNPHTPSIIEFVPKSSCITCNVKSFTCNLCGENFENADKEKFLRNKEPPSPNPNFMKSIINHNLNLRTNMTVTKTSSSLTTQGHQLSLLPPLNLKPKIQAVSESKSRTSMDMIGLERYRNWQERKQSKHSSRRTTSGARTTTGQKDLNQTNMTTATTRRGQQQHKALLSTCRKRKRLCPLRPAMPNLIQPVKNPLSKNRVECYHYCKNYGSIDLTNIGFRLRHLCSLDLHSAPPKHGILILNG